MTQRGWLGMLESTSSISSATGGKRASIRAKGADAMATEPLGEDEPRKGRRREERLLSEELPLARSSKEARPAPADGVDPAAGSSCERPEEELLQALAARDEEACRALIREHHATMVRVARGFVRTEAVAEEVAQETWVAMLQGLPDFRGQASLKTWLFGILIRRARAAGARENRSAALSQLTKQAGSSDCDPMDAFFHGAEHPENGSWAVPPQRWRRNPEDAALEGELLRTVGRVVRRLPEAQRIIVCLRDGEGWEAAEIAALLDRTPNWVRVNLHRARVKIRLAVIERLGREDSR